MGAIFLIGFMCSGKSTLGRAVASATKIPFIDLDDEIERRTGMSVSRIFEQHGEQWFRDTEMAVLSELAGAGNVIIACGGGTPCRPGAMEMMNGCGRTVYLHAEESRLIPRLLDGRNKRPLLRDIATADDMRRFAFDKIAERAPYYEKASIKFNSSHLETEAEIAETVSRFRQELSI